MDIKNLPICFNTSDDRIEYEFYETCLNWACSYDRGVGYFTSEWISKTAAGMTKFVAHGGVGRWIVSPVLDEKDYNVFLNSEGGAVVAEKFQALLDKNLDKLEQELTDDTLNALAWMIYDGILEFRFAVPQNQLREGDFHDKFGIFYGYNGDKISFNGSQNDSKKGFSNYESIKVFRSWDSTLPYVEYDISRFDKLWTNNDRNVAVYNMPEAVKERIFRLRTPEGRPYMKQKCLVEHENRWFHQELAIEKFMEEKRGILEMATGTGKTRTALRIMMKLFEWGQIDRVVLTMYGNDLLYQWEKEIRNMKTQDIRLFRCFNTINEMSTFVLSKKKAILLISRDADKLSMLISSMGKRNDSCFDRTLVVFDEVHGLGSLSLRMKLDGLISKFSYRLGLSATPEREYDEEGNRFIQNEVGPVIFRFTLEDAIRRGILCEFSYMALNYELTDEEKRKKRNIIAYYEMQRKNGRMLSKEEEYRALAKVNKCAVSKLPLFAAYINQYPQILDSCIIFVEDKEYGEKVQNILIKVVPEYHTYYSEDNREELLRFAKGELKCLLTCKKISEGVDIKSVKNIILFSSDKARLVTIQRIGRSLRLNANEPDKRAFVLDFVQEDDNDNFELNSDMERREWLTELSKVRREEQSEGV
ncbi:DEAD/DEAH box helicase family protein [Enterocloster asparagiformis]|nr:DEAD/DEAH box helicase family protein [Enterocloster asparagiformis]UWO77145.1 DEAD/DEAH box helicase family protein [[Clostridium] asparagiforme DSM 15981]